MFNRILLLILMLFSLGIHACKTSSSVDVSGIELKVNAYDFYKDFSKLDTNDILNGLEALKNKYPQYLSFYLDTLAVGTVSLEDSIANIENIKYFLSHKDYRSLMDTVEIVYPQTDEITADIIYTLKHIAYYDSSIDLPQNIYYAVSGLSKMVALSGYQNLTVGLDYFLGPDYPPYTQIRTPQYQLGRLDRPYIPIAISQLIYLDNYPLESEGKDLLALMIAQGKMQYFLSLVTPQAQEHMRFGFSLEQMKWCEENEKFIFKFFTANEMLYSKDVHKILRYVNDGPFSTGMPEESPGNTGSFIGYKIVKAYVEKTGTSLPALLAEQDAVKMLTLSKYNP